jgi:hypothetical protein
MRSTITYFMERVATMEQLQLEVSNLIEEPLKFIFNFADAVQYEEIENLVSCLAIEEMGIDYKILLKYPNILSNDPIVEGKTSFRISINNNNIIKHDDVLIDPTWKDILKNINNILTKNNLKDLVLYTIDIVGLTNDGLGYELEAVMVDPNSEYN